MTSGAVFDLAIKDTFGVRALRTAIVIDDQFPTFSDVVDNNNYRNEFSEYERASRLYKVFRKKGLPCDVENRIGLISDDEIDRIRKSDLIVLDYHLTPNSQDASKSISIIKKLSQTKHFNTIVLYTAEPDLQMVWRNIALSIRGGWSPPADGLSPETEAVWEDLSNRGKLKELSASESEIANYCLDDEGASLEFANRLDEDFVSLGVDSALRLELSRALLEFGGYSLVSDESKQPKDEQSRVKGACSVGKPIWLQCKNCFIVVLRKPAVGVSSKVPAVEPENILDSLDEALVSWNPSILQILISEIQNILELEALATDEDYLQDPNLQVGLFYHLLNLMSDVDNTFPAEKTNGPVQSIIDKLVDSVRNRVSKDSRLVQLVESLIPHEFSQIKWPIPAEGGAASLRFVAASTLARTPNITDRERVMFELNSFLSMEPFEKSHITTGTIIKEDQSGHFWVCASPACDMTVRSPKPDQMWPFALHPMRPIIAVRLLPVEIKKALKSAHAGNHVFLIEGDKRVPLTLIGQKTEQPLYEFIFPLNAGRVKSDRVSGRKTIDGFRIKGPDNENTANPATQGEDREFQRTSFSIVGQMRSLYANKVLQSVGQHLSRIGTDFVQFS